MIRGPPVEKRCCNPYSKPTISNVDISPFCPDPNSEPVHLIEESPTEALRDQFYRDPALSTQFINFIKVRPSVRALPALLRRVEPQISLGNKNAGRSHLIFLARENAREIPRRFAVAFFLPSSFKTRKRNMPTMRRRGAAFQILTILSRGCICVESKNIGIYARTQSAEAFAEDWGSTAPVSSQQREPKQHAASACTSACAVLPSLARLLRLLAQVLSSAPQKKNNKKTSRAGRAAFQEIRRQGEPVKIKTAAAAPQKCSAITPAGLQLEEHILADSFRNGACFM